MVDLRLLASFVAVAEELNFSRAAARLRIAQPALSRQIRLLETELGGTLFERNKRRVALTEAGERVLEQARVTLAHFERTVAVGRSAMSGQVGLVRLATTSASVFHPRTADVIHSYRTRWTQVQLELQEMPGSHQFEAIAEGRIDLGIVHLDEEFIGSGQARRWPALRFESLAREGLVAALPVAHQLAKRTQVTLMELADEAFLTLPRRYSPEYGGPFRRLEKLRGSAVRMAQEVLNVPAMVHLAGAGLGVALVPECLTSIRAERVRYVPVKGETASRILALVHADGENRPAVRNFIDLAARKPKKNQNRNESNPES